MPSFEIQADIFTRLSVFDSPKGSSNTFKTHKNISLYFKRRYLLIYKNPIAVSEADLLSVYVLKSLHFILAQSGNSIIATARPLKFS